MMFRMTERITDASDLITPAGTDNRVESESNPPAEAKQYLAAVQ